MSIIEIKAPVFPESVADATIIEWYKQSGQMITEGEKLVDIETDKVVLEVVAPKNGVLKILRDKGASIITEELIDRKSVV